MRPAFPRGIDGGETPGRAAELPLERIVAARIQDHDVDPILCLGHLPEQEIHVDGGDSGGSLGIDLGVDRDQIVASADRRPWPA